MLVWFFCALLYVLPFEADSLSIRAPRKKIKAIRPKTMPKRIEIHDVLQLVDFCCTFVDFSEVSPQGPALNRALDQMKSRYSDPYNRAQVIVGQVIESRRLQLALPNTEGDFQSMD